MSLVSVTSSIVAAAVEAFASPSSADSEWNDVAQHVAALYITSSVARHDDFILGNSDVDFLVIFYDDDGDASAIGEKILRTVCAVWEKTCRFSPFLACFQSLPASRRLGQCDPLILGLSKLPRTSIESETQRFAMLGVFGFDLVHNHILIAGNDLLKELYQPPQDPSDFASRMLSTYRGRAIQAVANLETARKEAERSDDSVDVKMLEETWRRVVLAVGTYLRVLAISRGLTSISKTDIRRHFLAEGLGSEALDERCSKHFELLYVAPFHSENSASFMDVVDVGHGVSLRRYEHLTALNAIEIAHLIAIE